jgi:hypothetical protein
VCLYRGTRCGWARVGWCGVVGLSSAPRWSGVEWGGGDAAKATATATATAASILSSDGPESVDSSRLKSGAVAFVLFRFRAYSVYAECYVAEKARMGGFFNG